MAELWVEERKKKSWHFLKFSLWFFGGPLPTPHILLLSENLLINEIPSSLVHSKPPSKPNQCVCVWERERCVWGGVYSYRQVSPQRGSSTKEKSISAGQRPPCLLGDGSNPRILMRHPFKGPWTLEKAPHTVLLSPSSPLHGSPSPTPNQHASGESLATSSFSVLCMSRGKSNQPTEACYEL